MKKIILIAFFVLFLTSCSPSIVERGVIQTKTNNYYKKSFSYLDGEEKVKMKLDSNSEAIITFEIEIKDGTLEFIIEDASGTVIETVSKSSDVEFETGDQNYYLIINAEEAKGKFKVVWGR